MKLIVVLAVTFAIFGSSIVEASKKQDVLKFYNCLACSESHEPIEDFQKCAENRPAEIIKMVEQCKVHVMPEAKTLEQRMETICKNEDIAEKLYDCIKDPRHKAMFEEHKNEMKEFKECAMKVYMEHCPTETE